MSKVKTNDSEVLFVAEISANHLGNRERALELVKSAVESGANAVKFQTYTPYTMTLDIVSHLHTNYGVAKNYISYTKKHIHLGIGILNFSN